MQHLGAGTCRSRSFEEEEEEGGELQRQCCCRRGRWEPRGGHRHRGRCLPPALQILHCTCLRWFLGFWGSVCRWCLPRRSGPCPSHRSHMGRRCTHPWLSSSRSPPEAATNLHTKISPTLRIKYPRCAKIDLSIVSYIVCLGLANIRENYVLPETSMSCWMTIWGSMSRMACTRQSASEHSAGLGHIVIAGASANPIQKSVMHQPSHVIIVTFRSDELPEAQHRSDYHVSPYNKHDQLLNSFAKFNSWKRQVIAIMSGCNNINWGIHQCWKTLIQLPRLPDAKWHGNRLCVTARGRRHGCSASRWASPMPAPSNGDDGFRFLCSPADQAQTQVFTQM